MSREEVNAVGTGKGAGDGQVLLHLLWEDRNCVFL